MSTLQTLDRGLRALDVISQSPEASRWPTCPGGSVVTCAVVSYSPGAFGSGG